MSVFLAEVLQAPDLSKHSTVQTVQEVLHNPLVQVGLAIIAFVIINMIVRELVGSLVRRSVRPNRYKSKEERQKRATTVAKVSQTAASGVIWIFAVLFILGLLHVPIAGLATGAGLVSVIIGLGAQNTLKDFLAGFFIILENQYAVGDIITIRTLGGFEVTGKVEDLSIRITKMRDLEGVQHIITNGAGLVISNSTANFSAVNMTVHIGYTADFDKVADVINKVGKELATDEQWEKDIIEPIRFFRIDSFEDYAVAALMIGKTRPGRQFDVEGEFRARLLRALKASKIKVPTSQVVAGKAIE